MRVFYDTEFLERGPDAPIVLISIGMVREDGATLYCVNGELTTGHTSIIKNHPWLGPNVYAHLPQRAPTNYVTGLGVFDYDHPDVFRMEEIRLLVSEFCAESLGEGEKAELWAWYADYDHVVLSQIFGRMVDLPAHMPMYTRDLKQEVDVLEGLWRQGRLSFRSDYSSTPLNDLVGGPHDAEHNAMADARQLERAYRAVCDWIGADL